MTNIQKKKIREYFRLFDGPGSKSVIESVSMYNLDKVVEVVVKGRHVRDGGYDLRGRGRPFRDSYALNRRGKEIY